MAIRKRIKDPLLGFGWAGYICAAILIALIAALVAGVEIRYEILKLIQTTLGVEAMMLFVIHLPFAGFSIGGVSISVTTGVAILIAFKVAPYRINPLLQLAVFLLCAGWFLVPLKTYRVVGRALFGSLSFANYYLLEIVGTVLIGLVVFYLTRSRFVAAMWALAVAVASINALWFANSGISPPGTVSLFTAFDLAEYTSLSLAFDTFTMGSLVLWAILERRKIFPDQMCQSCEYNLAGLSGDATCPECGRKQAAIPIPPAASMAPRKRVRSNDQ